MNYNPATDVITFKAGNKVVIKPNGDCFQWIPPKELSVKEYVNMIGASSYVKDEYMLQYDRKNDKMFYLKK